MQFTNPKPIQSMPNPFLTNAPNKKGRYQDKRQDHSHRQDHGHRQDHSHRQDAHRQGQGQGQDYSHRQDQVQENPFLTAKRGAAADQLNHFSSFLCAPEPVQIPPSFEESFPSLTQSNAQTQAPVPKLNFKSAVQQSNQSNQSNQINQSNHQIHQIHQIQSSHQPIHHPIQIQNQFLRPINQFLQPRSVNDHVRYNRAEHDDDDDCGNNNDAYDSAYTKYYDD